MYKPGELEIVIGKALGKWAEENKYTSALPPVWLREMSERVRTYYDRLTESGRFDKTIFEDDVYKHVCSLAVGFLPKSKPQDH